MLDEVTKEKTDKIARELLRMSKSKLLVNLRFLDMALSRLVPTPDPEHTTSCATDGEVFIYDPKHILTMFRVEEDTVTRSYLHVLLHCVFKHMFVNTLVNQQLWNIACDIAVESVINDLKLDYLTTLRAGQQEQLLNGFHGEIKTLSAEKIYRFLLDKKPPQKSIDALEMLFRTDDHFLWYLTDEQKSGLGGYGGSENGIRFRMSRADLINDWTSIGKHTQTDIEMFGKKRGTEAGLLTQNLREVNRERCDYTEFLKKFAVRGEIMRINPDEFDYNFYTYGLTLYENMPLIEPLEYKEVKAIREFVIAIDTSSSTSGELVRKFVQKTYNILKSSESFFTKINLHIIQCDAAIQEDIKITSREDFDKCLKSMEIYGLGGTDFRPMFSYVNSLSEIGEFANLRGLIYLTDGFGAFPAKKPDYETAFVFLDDEPNNYNVPPWAIKLVLRKDEI